MKPGFYWLQKALLSHYWRHPWQTLFLITGLVSGVGLWSAVQIINHHAEDSYRDAQSLLGAQAHYWIQHRRGEGVKQDDYIKLRRRGFSQIFPVIELEVSTADSQSLSLIATDLLAIPGGLFEIGNNNTDFARSWLNFIQPPFRAWVPAILAGELGIGDGQQIELRDGRMLPPALIQAREQQGRRILLDIGAAMTLAGDDRLSYLAVGTLTPDEQELLSASLPVELELIENQQHLDLQDLTASLHSHLTAMSLLSFAVGLFIVFNAVRFSLWYRRTTLLNLRLMGCSVRQLVAAIALETVFWSIVGTVIGFVFGVLLAQLLLPALGSSLHSLFGATIEGDLGISSLTLIQAWSITLFGLVLALAWPLYRQLGHATLQAGSSDVLLHDESIARKRLFLGAAGLGLLAWIAYAHIATVNQGFIVLGAILFAAAWALPSLLAGTLRMLSKLLPVHLLLTRWMISDGWAQLPSLRTAMMALLLALTANLGVATLVDSFRLAFISWLEARQSADIYARSPLLDYELLKPGVENSTWLADSHHRIGVTSRWQGRPSLIRGLDPNATDSRNLPLSLWLGETQEQALTQWREQTSKVLVNEQVHFLAGIEIGEMIELDSDSGTRHYQVVGIFYDYGNPYFQFYLPRAEVEKNWPNYYSRGIALWLNSANPEAMAQALTVMQQMGAKPGDWITREQVHGLSVGIFDRTFAITASMNLLTMIVAAMALLASLLAILHERLPQFAQWRALGLRRREQLMLVATPLLLFCLVVWTLSLPLGALLSWILINKLNIISFGWSMPLTWSFKPALTLGLVVIFICTLTLLMLSYLLRKKMPRALAQLGEVH